MLGPSEEYFFAIMYNHEEIQRRAACFRLLAACFCQPERELFIEEDVCPNLARLLQPLSPDAGKAARAMAEALETLDQERLSVDHAALFLGPFELAAAPYGSVYLEQSRRLMGDSTMAVRRCYEEAGLAVEIAEAPDHVALELEFMHYLLSCQATALVEGREGGAADLELRQNEFFHHFLNSWMEDFCRAIRSGTVNPFYLALAECLGFFIAACRQIQKTPSAPA